MANLCMTCVGCSFSFLQVLLQDINLTYLRLDGSTPVKQRQDLIDTFNTDTTIPGESVFFALLGHSRFVFFDNKCLCSHVEQHNLYC